MIGFTYDSLTRLVTGGYYGTAPFSEWTYAFFIGLILPLVICTIIFMITTIFDEKEIRARRILFSAPISQCRYYLMKAFTIVIAFLLITMVPIIISFLYYKVLFNFTDLNNFIELIFWFMVPTFVFFLGFCMVLGRISIKLLYGLIPIAFLLGLFDTSSILPYWLDIYGAHYFKLCTYAELLGRTSDVVTFNLSASFVTSRFMLLFFGIILLAFACVKTVKE